MTATEQHGTHNDLHSERRGLPGDHVGRARNPVIKVRGIAWLEFAKPDLRAAERFAHAFGFTTAAKTPGEVQLRGRNAGAPCVILRQGTRSKFLGPTFEAAETADLVRLAAARSATVSRMPESIGGAGVELVDPSGLPVRVVADTHVLPALPAPEPLSHNFGTQRQRINSTRRPPRAPAQVQRLGHVVLQSTKYQRALDWYLENLGLIVSDFLYFDGQRHRGSTMSFIRCDRGDEPADHHTLAMTLGPSNRYVHSAYEVADLDTLAAGGQYLLDEGYRRSWGIGRHIQGSQIFDYWRDPDGFLVEHYSDGDVFDSTLEPGWAPMTASGLAQWGPPASRDFLGIAPGRESLSQLRSMIGSLREDNEWDLERLRGLIKVAST